MRKNIEDLKHRYKTPVVKDQPDFPIIEAFVVRFLEEFIHAIGIRDWDHYYGELFNTCLQAEARFDPAKGMTLNSYFFLCCKDRANKINKREVTWYTRHVTHVNLNLFSKSKSPFSIAEHNETIEAVRNSELSPRIKEVIEVYLTEPHLDFGSIAERMNVSKQRISQIINSAKQFFSRRNVEIANS